jgi:hypothetical protein
LIVTAYWDAITDFCTVVAVACTVVAVVFTSPWIAARACMTALLSGVLSTFLSKEYVAVMMV